MKTEKRKKVAKINQKLASKDIYFFRGFILAVFVSIVLFDTLTYVFRLVGNM